MLKRSTLINKGRDLGVMFQGGDPRRNAPSAKQSRDQKVRFDLKSNVLNNSTDEDKYQEEIGQTETMKHLKEKLLPPH